MMRFQKETKMKNYSKVNKKIIKTRDIEGIKPIVRDKTVKIKPLTNLILVA